MAKKPASSTSDETVRHRSGAVARMLRMPVATLRVWERRYALTQAELSASGQRLYSMQDVQRLALIKQLVDRGHGIGRLAGLEMSQLRAVALEHTQVDASVAASAAPRPWRVVVLGAGLAAQLRRPTVLRRLRQPLTLLGPFADALQAAQGLQGASADALLVQLPGLQPGWLEQLRADAPMLAGLPTAVLYGYASQAQCDALALAGVAVLREPQDDAAMAQWLQQLHDASARAPAEDEPGFAAALVPPRRWDDVALAQMSVTATEVACECPRHVADLLLQLARFEAYSAACASRDPDDAQLHAYLQQVAGVARSQFEAALERVALHEGLMLPP